MNRRSRIQIKPNISKALKSVKKEDPVVLVVESNEPVIHEEVNFEPIKETTSNCSTKSESSKKNEGDKFTTTQHVHFQDDANVIESENRISENSSLTTSNEQSLSNSLNNSGLLFSNIAKLPPRSRNISMCDDESIMYPKQSKERKRFSGLETIDTKTWTMSDFAHYNPKHEKAIFKRERKLSNCSTVPTKSEIPDNSLNEISSAPQLKIGIDGRLIIDESSLVVNTANLGNNDTVWETIEEGRNSSKITSMSFRHKIMRKSIAWTEKETDLFYEVLKSTGSDFGLMQSYLPQRSRYELKAKYNKEERLNWDRMKAVMSKPTALDETLPKRVAARISEIEAEVEENKRKIEYQREEEKRVKQELKEKRLAEREDERMRKIEVKEVIRKAKEREYQWKAALKLEKEVERQTRIEAKLNAKALAENAKRLASEARVMLKNDRSERDSRDWNSMELDVLEREAERIIRRLIKESKAEKKASRTKNTDISELKSNNDKLNTEHIANSEDSNENNDYMTSESSSSEESDEDAFSKKMIVRENKRMEAERRNIQPRKVVIEKKPRYVQLGAPKYAGETTSKMIEVAKKGGMFDYSCENDDVESPLICAQKSHQTVDPTVNEKSSKLEIDKDSANIQEIEKDSKTQEVSETNEVNSRKEVEDGLNNLNFDKMTTSEGVEIFLNKRRKREQPSTSANPLPRKRRMIKKPIVNLVKN